MRPSISPSERLSITLRYLASGNSFDDLKFLIVRPNLTSSVCELKSLIKILTGANTCIKLWRLVKKYQTDLINQNFASNFFYIKTSFTHSNFASTFWRFFWTCMDKKLNNRLITFWVESSFYLATDRQGFVMYSW